ncbi:galectin-12 isoform X6 [Macaca thibetana thibetana]|uniref:galectin-12 isoform X6 n=1 Tax=Macaca thibetana thibetana TaxID=257877 RepID=UPI0021BC84BE|nr:galectin-12 isoform X6 [Macaca thibetana thibetana]
MPVFLPRTRSSADSPPPHPPSELYLIPLRVGLVWSLEVTRCPPRAAPDSIKTLQGAGETNSWESCSRHLGPGTGESAQWGQGSWNKDLQLELPHPHVTWRKTGPNSRQLHSATASLPPGGSLCHDNFWRPACRQDGHAARSGPSRCTQVSVNGQHFLHFRYRLPLSHVDTLGIFGDILVEAVGFLNINPFVEGSREYPAGHPFLLMSPRLVSEPPSCSIRAGGAVWEVPCSHALPQGLWPGQVIIVRALVLQEPKQQNSGLDIPLGAEEADLSPLPLLPPEIL